MGAGVAALDFFNTSISVQAFLSGHEKLYVVRAKPVPLFRGHDFSARAQAL